jgi:integrase
MAKLLTDAAIRKFKPDPNHRREISDLRARGLHLVIEPSGTKSWGYRYRRPGSGTSANLRLGRVDFSGREHDGELRVGDPLTLSGARALAAECERQRLRGRDPAAEKQLAKRQARIVHVERKANTFAAAARQFCDEYKIPKKGKPRGWQYTARLLGLDYSQGEPTLVPHGLAELWRERLITEITASDIYSMVDEAKRRGIPGMERKTEGLSDARARKMRDALGGMFGWLLQHRRINVDPTIGVWRPPPPAPRQRVLNCKGDVRGADELRWFWSATDAVGEPFGAALKLLLITGCRLREVSGMQWNELSDDFSVLHLPPERTKNGREHIVPLPQLARDIIRSVRKIEDVEFVLSSNSRTAGGSWNRIKRKLDERMLDLARAERGADATIEPWVLHDLRRTCASGMASIGIQPHIIEACLNHASGAKGGIAGVYNVEEYAKEKAKALTKWAEHIKRIITGTSAKIVPIGRKRGA